jgi:hypothetical protein
MTLAEVLIAIFVLAIGLMGILALFPLGAMHMAQAIKDDRCGTSESNATAGWHVIWKDQQNITAQRNRDPICRNDANPKPNGLLPPGYPYSAMVGPNAPIVDPDQNITNTPVNLPNNWMSPLPALPTATYLSTQPSYPVFVDPLGYFANQGTPQQVWLGGNQLLQFGVPYLTIPRRSIQAMEYSTLNPVPIQQTPQLRSLFYNRYFVLLDDLGFGPDAAISVNSNPSLGQSASSTPWGSSAYATTNPIYPSPAYAGIANSVQRDGRYSTAVMIRRPQVSLDSQAEMTVIVYSGRSVTSPSAETVITGNFFQMNRNSTEVLVNWSQLPAKPKLRKGNWILDGTMYNSPFQSPEVHGYFYRIIGVTDLGGTLMSLEIQQPSLVDAGLASNNGAGNPTGLLIIMENVAEVFERKTLSPNIGPGQ